MKKTLTIGIPVYNESRNIFSLIKSILSQNLDGLILKKIIISSDGSTDKTTSIVRSLKERKIKLIENKDRKGIARGLNQINKLSSSDILVTLDGDIKIHDRDFIQKLIDPIIKNKADLTSSAIREVNPTTNFAKILQVGMGLKENLFSSFQNVNNLYTCHGLARGYSRKLYQNIFFPVSVGNDMYSYLFCKTNKFIYQYTPSALVFYRLPSNYKDHEKQSLRFFNSATKQTEYFNKKMVSKETSIPTSVYFVGFLKSILTIMLNPLKTVLYFLIQLYMKFKSNRTNSEEAWISAETTKTI